MKTDKEKAKDANTETNMENNKIEVGDTVWTTKQLYFVDGINPVTGEAIEMRFARGDTLTVHAIVEDRYECKTQAGMIAYLDATDIEGA